jgi:hypothetical protein
MCILSQLTFYAKLHLSLWWHFTKLGLWPVFCFPKNKKILEIFVFLVKIRWSLLFFWKHLPNICYQKIGKNNFMTYCHQTILFCFHYSLLIRNYVTTHLLWKATLFIMMAIHKIQIVTYFFFLQTILYLKQKIILEIQLILKK